MAHGSLEGAETQTDNLHTLRMVDGVLLALCKSTKSAGAGACVAAAQHPISGEMVVTDTKQPGLDAPVLRFTPREWGAFVIGVRAGEFDPVPEA